MRNKIIIALMLVIVILISQTGVAEELDQNKLQNLNYKEKIMYIADVKNIKLFDKEPNENYPFYISEGILNIYAKTNQNTELDILKDTEMFLKPLSDSNNLPNSILFIWQGKIIDKYGNESLGNIMIFEISKKDLKKINWDNFYYGDLPQFDPYYYIHKDLK